MLCRSVPALSVRVRRPSRPFKFDPIKYPIDFTAGSGSFDRYCVKPSVAHPVVSYSSACVEVDDRRGHARSGDDKRLRIGATSSVLG